MRQPNPLRKLIGSAAIALGLLVSVAASAGTAPTLRYDPFRSPPSADRRADSPSRSSETADTFSPVLRSTVVSGSRALVNLGGEVLAIGEETHGYRLLAVGLYDAVFEKEGRRVQLEVHSERDE